LSIIVGMSTPKSFESHATTTNIFSEFDARLDEQAVAEGGPSDETLATLHQSLRGAAIRTGASGILYGEVDASAVVGAAADEASASQPRESYGVSGSALADTEALAAILADAQDLTAPDQAPPPQAS
jgi:hypothetical protein